MATGAGVDDGRVHWYIHEQASLSTGAVTDNNELSADLSHGGGLRESGACRGSGSGILLRRQRVSGRWAGVVIEVGL
jgi:hypothetical protein